MNRWQKEYLMICYTDSSIHIPTFIRWKQTYMFSECIKDKMDKKHNRLYNSEENEVTN